MEQYSKDNCVEFTSRSHGHGVFGMTQKML